MPPVPSNAELIEWVSDGSLAVRLGERLGLQSDEDRAAVRDRLVGLHNSGDIDLLQLVEDDHFARIPVSGFFTASYEINRVIPRLMVADAKRLIAVIERLVALGKGDGMANQPNAAFRNWCAADNRRSEAVISAAVGGDEASQRYLSFALEALGDVPRARGLLTDPSPAVRAGALLALERLQDDDVESSRDTLRALAAAHAADAGLALPVLRTTLARVAAHPVLETDAQPLIERSTENPEAQVIHYAAQGLHFYPQLGATSLAALLVRTFTAVLPEHKGSIIEIDQALSALLGGPNQTLAIKAATALVGAGAVSIDEVPSFLATLHEVERSSALAAVVVSWLGQGNSSLARATIALVRDRDLRGRWLEPRATDLPAEPAAQRHVVRQAIGWLIVQPTSALSIAVAVLRHGDPANVQPVASLIADPLLRQYGGLREIVEAHRNDEPRITPLLDAALDADARYTAALASVPMIAELRPSDRNRWIERRRLAEESRATAKEAESQSIFASLVTRSTLLHGANSLTLVQDGDQLRPVHVPMNEMSFSFELPRGEHLDPVGLDLMLRQWRMERPPE